MQIFIFILRNPTPIDIGHAKIYDSVMSKPNQHLCSHIFFLASLLDVCPKTRRSDNCTYNRRYHLKPWLHIGTLPYLSCFIDYNHLFIDNLNRFFKCLITLPESVKLYLICRNLYVLEIFTIRVFFLLIWIPYSSAI